MDDYAPLKAMLRQKAQLLDAELERKRQAREAERMQSETMDYSLPANYQEPPAQVEQIQQMPSQGQYTVLPTNAPVTQRFGNYNPELYQGINKTMTNSGVDFGVKEGTPIGLPKGNWKVVEAYTGSDFNRGYGRSVLVVNEDTGERLRMSHLSRVNVLPGQRIAGGVVGLSGRSGNVTGPHLDLEYYDSKGKLADVTASPYARYLFGS